MPIICLDFISNSILEARGGNKEDLGEEQASENIDKINNDNNTDIKDESNIKVADKIEKERE